MWLCDAREANLFAVKWIDGFWNCEWNVRCDWYGMKKGKKRKREDVLYCVW